jgi:hypothetical protein
LSAEAPLDCRRRGRPPACPLEVVLRVVELRQQGMSYGAISRVLNAEGLATPGGRPLWQRSYVDRLLHTRYAVEILWADGEPGGEVTEG